MRPVRMAARGLLGAFFIASGARALADPDPLLPRAKRVTDRISPAIERAGARLPADGSLAARAARQGVLALADTRNLVRLNGAVQLVGGALLATGDFSRPAAVALAGSIVPRTVADHPFWAAQGAQRREQELHFLKNLGLLGGLLLAAVDTGGRPGLRWRAGRMIDDVERSVSRTARSTRRRALAARRGARLAARGARLGRFAGRRLHR